MGYRYSLLRRPDPRISHAIVEALGDAHAIVNVGAGAGSYEPQDRPVVAVEPSRTMIDQRSKNSAPVIQGSALALPFADHSFDAALAVLTVHHWENWRLGLSELRRIARKRAVVFTWDPEFDGFWLTDYFPEILDIDRRIFPSLDRSFGEFGRVTIRRLPIPADCTDGFLCAYWSRPHAYLEPSIRSGISTFSKLADTETGLANLERNLSEGVWDRRYGHIRDLPQLDLGYAVVVIDF